MIKAFFAKLVSGAPKDPKKKKSEKLDGMTISEEHQGQSLTGGKSRNLLLDMPSRPLTEILSKCDFVAVQSIRKTCNSVREFVDNGNFDPNFKCLGLQFEEDSIQMTLYLSLQPNENKIILIYKNKEKDTTLIRKTNERTKEKLVKDVNFVELFCQDFRVLTEKSKSIPQIYFKIETENLLENIFEKFQQILEIRNFKTTQLSFYVTNSGHILSILPFFDSNFLNFLYVRDSLYQRRTRILLRLDEIVELEQWRRLKDVVIDFFIVQMPERFKNLNKCRVNVDTFTRADLEILKEAYLHSPNFSLMNLTYSNLDVDLTQLYDAMGDHGFFEGEENANVRRRWLFRHPNGVLDVVIQPNDNNVFFSIPEPADIPAGAIIKQ